MAVCVGAMMVGSIETTVQEGEQVKRGQELGYFAFGMFYCFQLKLCYWVGARRLDNRSTPRKGSCWMGRRSVDQWPCLTRNTCSSRNAYWPRPLCLPQSHYLRLLVYFRYVTGLPPSMHVLYTLIYYTPPSGLISVYFPMAVLVSQNNTTPTFFYSCTSTMLLWQNEIAIVGPQLQGVGIVTSLGFWHQITPSLQGKIDSWGKAI